MKRNPTFLSKTALKFLPFYGPLKGPLGRITPISENFFTDPSEASGKEPSLQVLLTEPP
jgi:hypothetical protein